MISVPRFRPGDNLSQQFLDSIAQAIGELQSLVGGVVPKNDLLDTFQIQNNSGGDLDAYSVLGISDSYFDPGASDDEERSFQNGQPVLVGITPADPDHVGKFVVTLEPLKNGHVGMAVASGICSAKINVASEDADNSCADIDDGETGSLKPTLGGSARVLWLQSGTGVKWAVVRLGSGGGTSTQCAMMKITAGPDANGYYTVRKQAVSGFATYADADSVDRTLVFLRAAGDLPSGSSSYVSGTYILAWYFGHNAAGDEIWIANDTPGWWDLGPVPS